MVRCSLFTAALLCGARVESGGILNRQGLEPFFENLERGGGPVHILQFGDSQTASDDWVNAMRQQFQSVHGNGGRGWVTAGHIRCYRRWDARGGNSAGWTVDGAVGHPGDSGMGLGGFSLTTTRAGEWISIETDAAKLALLYLKMPGAGSFDVSVDDQVLASVDGNGERGLGRCDVPGLPGMHRYTLRTTMAGMPVRVFGWAADNESGVTWETLGINGAPAEIMLEWDRALWTAQLKERDPALVILAYGTNEALSRRWTAASYRGTLSRLIALLHETVPDAGHSAGGTSGLRPGQAVSASVGSDCDPEGGGNGGRRGVLGLAQVHGRPWIGQAMGAPWLDAARRLREIGRNRCSIRDTSIHLR